MDVNSRDPSQNILPFRIKGVEAARFDICGNLGIGTTAPTANLEVVGTVKISGAATIVGNTTIAGNINLINNASTNYNSINSGITINGRPIENKTTAVVNIDSQPAMATALNRQKKQSIPLAAASTLATSDIIAKMSGVSVGKTQTYGVGAAQMASYGNIVVAVGDGTNSIAYSLTNPPTASSWVGIPTTTLFNGVASTFSTRGRNITYANGTWVAVGEGTNCIAYSTMTPPVASSWVGIPTGSTLNNVVNTFNGAGRDIAYGNGAWVAVSEGTNTIAYSLANPPTAESWVGIPSSTTSNFGSTGWSITFGNGTWVATGSGTNGIAYSTRTPPTSDSWVVVPLTNQNDAGIASAFSTGGGGVNVIYANGVWLAAGNGTNTLCYSVENPPIAGSWMPITNGVLFGSWGRSLAYGNGTWVACGESTTLLAYSTARIPHSSSWVAMKGPTPSSNGEIINHVTFNAATNTWYFLGDISNNCMFYSTATPPVPATWVGVQKSTGAFTTQAFGAIGITTNAFTAPINVARLDNKVTFPTNRMLAVGGGGSGIDVVTRSSASPAPVMTGTISYSDDDGANWAMVPGGATNAMFSSAADIAAGVSFGVGGSRGANAVAWNGEKWVAGGNGRTNSLAFSDDGGMTWNGVTGKSVFSVEARDIAWNGQMWVAVGRGIVFSTAYSYDGVTWMGPVTNDVSSVPINVFSYDIAGPAAGSSDISGGGNHVVWTGKMWVAAGTRTLIAGSSPAAYYTVAYSVDGKTWTGVADSGATSTGFDMYAYGVAWNGRNLVATGRGTVNTLAFSTDASSAAWQGLGNSVFSVWGRGITWGARRWMATGRGTNTVAFSTNGRNWQGCGANVFKPLRRFMAMGDTGLYTGQRGVAFTYSDDGVTWDAPVVNQAVEFSAPIGATTDTTRSVIWSGQMLLTNVITDNGNAHQSLMYSTDAGASWLRVPGSSDTEANGGTGLTNANLGCLSIAANTARTRFIAGGGDSASATRKVYFSNDGFNWNRGVSSPNSNTQFAWVYTSLWVGGGYNRWLIGGNNVTTQANGMIMYSGDADAVAPWTAASGTFTSTIISCFAANTNFSVILAGAATGNKIYRAANNGGTTWTTTDISTTPIGSVRSIAFSPSLGRWVAVGGGSGAANTIIYSTDASGTTWTASPIQAKAAATAIFKNGSEVTRVIWDALGGRFIIGGWNGGVSDYTTLTNVAGADGVNNNPGYTMAYSADGVNWTPVTVRTDTSSATATTSTSGSTSGSTFGPFITRCREIMALDVSGDFTPINTGYSVTWNSYANRFVATGNGTTPVVYSSDGGVTWTPANQQPPQQAIAIAGGASAAANTSSASPITYTIDGKTWSQAIGAKEAFGSSGTVLCVKYGQTSTAISPNGRIWVAGGTGTSCLAFSQNGIRWTAITSASTMITNVRTIAYAPADQTHSSTSGASNAALTAASGVGNGVWVAGGDTTNSLIFSYDGISWSEVPGSLSILTRCNAVAFGNGIFVAGGSAATATPIDPTAVLVYSTDGINWQPIRGTISRISASAVIQSIAYGRDERGRGLWVAGATYVSGNPTVTLFYSYNGIDWIGINDSATTLSASINGIAYGISATTGQGLWMAAVYNQSSYSFLFSTTGRDGWTTVTNTKTGLFEPLVASGATGIAYLNGVWYATGLSAGISTGRTLAYSYDGSGGWFGVYPSSNMYGSVIPTFSPTGMNCVGTTNDYVIPAATAGTPAAMVPVRSIGWTAGVGSAYLQHPTLLFGSTTTTTTATATATTTAISADGGRSWGSSLVSLSTSAFRGGVCNDAFWNGTIWVAVGYDAVSGAKVATSRDGVAWSQIPAGAVPITGILYSVMWNGTVWMVGGDGSPTNDENTTSIAWSTDLAVWNGVANTDTKLNLVKRISWNGMYWVAVGLGTVSTMAHSKDRNGLVWEDTYLSSSSTNKTGSITSVVNDVVWGGGRWVAVGRGNDIVGGGGVSILYSADTPVVGGEPAEYAITGRRWTGIAASAQLFPYGANSVSWNGKRFVATGPAYSSKSGTAGNIIAWSADGISWTAYSTTKTVAPGQRWVAVGSGSAATIATSADGRTWTDVSGSPLLFSDISGATTAVVNTMLTGARAIGWNGSSLIIGGSRSATTMTETSRLTATATTGRTTIPVCAFIGSGNGVMGGGTTNAPDAVTQSSTMRASSSVFITHLDVNMREASAPWANMWLNTYTDLSATQLFQVTPESQSFSSALKWNGWSWVANFGTTAFHPLTGEQYGSIWYCTDPLARVGWSVASNSAVPRILIGQGGYAGLEWNGVAWLACGYDPNNNNMIYTTDKYGATGWTAVSGIVSGGSASFQPVCIASSSRFWVVGGSQGTTSALYYTNDRTGATGWKVISTATSVLPGIRITSVGYNGVSWICCGGGGGGSGSPASSISWRADAVDDIGTGWAAATFTSGGIPSNMSNSSAIAFNVGAASPTWVVVGDVSGNDANQNTNQVSYTTSLTGSADWNTPSLGSSFTLPTYTKLNGIAWTGHSWIASCGAGASRIASSTDVTASRAWNNTSTILYSPTLCTNAVTYANIPISLLTTGMMSSAGVGAGAGAMWRGGVGRAQGLLPGGGSETTSVVVRSNNGAEGATWSQTYSRNFLIAVGGGIIRDANGNGGTNRMAYSYDGGLSWTTNNTSVLTSAGRSAVGSIRTVKYGNGMWVAGGDSAGSNGTQGNNCLAWSRDGVNWTGAGGTQIFGSAGACYAVCCNDRGRWVAVGGAALTTSGTYTNTSGAIYTMAWSDDGMNWTPILGSRALFGIVCQGVSYGADASGVGMWTAIGRGSAYTGCAYSYDGKTWYLSQTSGSLFGTSVNVLTERYMLGGSNKDWSCISLSSTGQYQSVMGSNSYIWISSDYGVTWASRTAYGFMNSRSISLSRTGQYQSTAVTNGGNIMTSSDYGVTWTSRTAPGSLNWFSISLSSTGQYQTAVAYDNNIQTSSDYGVTWTPRTDPGSLKWQTISLSSTGQYQSLIGYLTTIWTSSDYGVKWTSRTTPGSLNWNSISLSSTGQYQSAVAWNGNIWTSSNYGVGWTERTPTGGTKYWYSISLSSTGQYQSAVVNDGNIWTSSDYGVTWTARTAPGSLSWQMISLSSSGQYQTAVVAGGLIFISSNFGETWSSGATDSRSLGITYGKDASGVGMWVATAGRRDRDVAATAANTMAYSYDGKLWRGIRASAGLSEQAWSVAYGKDGFGVGMWVAAGYDATCGLKWSYDGITWNATIGASGSAVWAGAAAGRRALAVYWNGSMWLASTSDTRNGEPRGTGIAANNASGVPGYLLYSYNGKNWLPVLAPNTYSAVISSSAQPSVYSVLPNPAILDFGSFYDDQTQRGTMIANTTARTVGAVMSGVPIENINTIVPYGRGSLTTGQVPFLMGGDSGLVDSVVAGTVGVASGLPITSEIAASTTSLSTSTDGGITWRAVPNSTRVMTKVNKILCDESTQQIVAVGTGNYSVATSTPAKAADADGWVGVFGSRMTNTRTGLFEKYGTGATWFGGAKMWIASGRTQSRRGSSLAVSVNGTVWQDAKIVSQVAAGSAGTGRGGGLTSRTTGGAVTTTTTTDPGTDVLYTFTTFTFDNAGATGRLGPELATVRTAYTNRGATWATTYLNMTTRGIQEWTVPATGSYTIRAKGAAGGGTLNYGRGRDIQLTTTLTKGEVIKILVGQTPSLPSYARGGGGGTFVVRSPIIPIIIAGGGGGKGNGTESSNADASFSNNGNQGGGNANLPGSGGSSGAGGNGAQYAAGGGGLTTNGGNNLDNYAINGLGGFSFSNGGNGGTIEGGFGGGGGHGDGNVPSGAGGGGYSGGGGGGTISGNYTGGGGGGSYGITTLTDNGATNTSNGSVTITFNTFTITTTTIPYTAAATPLLTYTDSAAAFSTQVSSVATNSQYNRAVVGGSGVQFVAGGRGIGSNGSGLVYSNDGQNWLPAASGAATVFQTPTNVAAYSTAPGSGGFDASFGTVALTQRMSPPATYLSGNLRGISLSKTGQYQTALVDGGNIWTSSDYGVTWTERTTGTTRAWFSVSLSSTGQYQSAVVNLGNIWLSSDYGVTWTVRTAPGTGSWSSISLSSTGQYQSAVVNGGNIWTSSDFGISWTSRIALGSGISISISSTGQYQSTALYGGNIRTSSDYGVTWTAQTTPGTTNIRSISLSSSGQYQSAPLDGGNMLTSSDYGVTWTSRTAPGSLAWRSVSLSSTGQYQTSVIESGNIWTSSDYGVTWTERTTGATRGWRSVSLSSTGQYQSAVFDTAGSIFTSTDFGVTWVQRSTATKTNAFTRIKSSASGQYQLATSGPVGNTNGQLYVSSDYGQTWMPRRGLTTWLGGAVSATGAVMTAFLTPTAATATIIRSTDFGNTFTEIPNTALAGTAYWRSISVTNSASIQTALAYGGSIYRSSDTGATWSTAGITIDGTANTSTPRNWQDIAVAAETGATQVTCVSGGYIYYSGDTGATWVSSIVSIDGVSPQTTNRAWQAVTISANGQYGLACVNSTTASGFLYRSLNYGSSWSSSNIVIDGVGTQTTSRPWQDVGMSGNGKYQVACLNNISQTAFTSNITSTVSVMVPPPGAVATTYGSSWTQRGGDIDGEAVGDQSGYSVSLSADGTVVAIGAPMNFGANGRESGQVRVYALNAGVWTQRGLDIDGAAGLSSLPMVVTAGGTSPTGNWYSVSMSSTGQYQSAVVDGVGIYISYNYGVSWSLVPSENGAPTNARWQTISVSSSGQYQTAGANYIGYIYTSSNYGVNWNQGNLPGNWNSIAISSTGQYQSAVSTSGSGGGIYRSSDFGANWAQVPNGNGSLIGSSASFVGIAMSSNGQYQSATLNGTSIYLSSNFGVNWTVSTGNGAPNNQVWRGISMSSSGQYQTAVSYGNAGNYGPIYVSSDFGKNWTEKASSLSWYGVSMSSTGQYQTAPVRNGKIWISTDFGKTWTDKANSLDCYSVSLSSSGQYQTMPNYGSNMLFSRDYGFTWSTTASYEITEGDRSGISVSLSANGSTVAVGAPYYDLSGVINRGQVRVYDFSTNSLWIPRGSNIMVGEGSNDYSGMSMSMSQDGKVVAIGAPLNDGSGNLTDSGHVRVYAWDGSVWAQRGADIDGEVGLTATNRVVTAGGTSPTGSWRTISLSSTGQYQNAVDFVSGNMWVSSNYGINWIDRTTGTTAANKSWYSSSISSSGQYQTAVVRNGNIWTSDNFGISWTEQAVGGSSKCWHFVSLSSTGQYQTAVIGNGDTGNIWTSFNYGVTWAPRASVLNWYSVSLSSTGQYQTAVVYSGNIWTSSDFGVNWAQVALFVGITRSWISVSLSSTGQYQTATVASDKIWTSSDFGVTWIPRTTAAGSAWRLVSLSSTGQYQTAVVEPGNIWTSSDFGITWVDRTTGTTAENKYWWSVSLSSTGQYQTAVSSTLIYFSRDYGFTWSTYASYEITTGDQSGTSVSLSADGSVVAIGATLNDGSGNIIDSGQVRVYSWNGSTWVRRGAVDIDGKAINDQSGYSVSMSVDGTVMAIGAPFSDGSGNVVDSGHVRVYGWNGTDWIKRGDDIEGEAGVATPMTVVTAAAVSGTASWRTISLSSTGQYQSAGVYNGGNIWTSSDYGVNWITRSVTGGGDNWTSISLSSTGQYQSALITGGNIWTSSNYGVMWIQRDSGRQWANISISSTGQYQTATVNSGYIYTSSNYGVDWYPRQTDSNRSYYGVSVSSTGQYQTVTVITGDIWISSNFGLTWTAAANTGSKQWRNVSLSSTGEYQTAVVYSNSTTGYIYTSSDFGLSWTPRQTDTHRYWFSISISNNGQYQTAGAENGQIYTSSNFGTTWTPRLFPNRNYLGISVSSTGQYQTAVDNGGPIYFSRDYGFTWSSTASYEVVTGGDQSGVSVSLSANGNTVAVGAPYNDGTSGIDRGHVRVYDWNAGTSKWAQRGLDTDGEAVTDLAGWSVSLSADGSTVAFGAPMNDGSGNLLPNSGSVRVYNVAVTNAITYTSNDSGVADICGNLLIIKGASRTSNIVATQGGTTTNGVLNTTVSPYTLVYNLGTASTTSFIYYSKDYGASWSSLTAAGSRSWSSIALSENGGTISATTNDSAGAIFTYTMPDDQYYRPPAIANVAGIGGTTTATVRAITYGNSGTGAATDGYWVAGADASANTLAYSSNGMDWTAVVGSKTTLFNSVNGVAYGADLSGTPLWVAVGTPFVGSVPGSTAYSIAYSYNMTTWTGVRNLANFTGQGNHVAYGQDEYGTGMWVAVGQGSGVLAANLGDSSLYNGSGGGTPSTTIFYSYDGANWAAATGAGVFSTSGTDVAWGVDASGVATWVATGVGYTDMSTGIVTPGGQVAHSINGRVWTPIRNLTTTITPFTISALTVAYGRAGSQGAGAPLWMVGGNGGNVFAASSRPSAVDANAWYTISAIIAPSPAAPFPVCNSIGYSNGIWVAANNTDDANILARSIDGGFSWTPIPLSSVNGFMAGSVSVGSNAFCNYSLAYADYSNDTNLRSWVAIPGTKNFMFEGGVNTVASVSSNIVASTYNSVGNGTRAWWVAGGAGVSSAVLAYSTDPSGATGWTKSASAAIDSLSAINDVAFSPQTQRWLAVGTGASGTSTQNILFSDASGATWTASAVATPATPVITLNTCIWNQLDASASADGRWLAGGTRNDTSVSISTSATLYISTDISGAASPWTPIAGTGAILSQVYSTAFNGRVWIAAGVPATDVGSTSTLMSTNDPTGTTGWQGIPETNASISGFDTSARSIAWNADQQMWIATGENTGTVADASFSSVIYSLDVSGSAGTWRTVCESNSTCFSGQGNGIAFTGRKWLAAGEGTNQIVATADISANTTATAVAAATWSSGILSIGNANTVLPVRGTDIVFTGRNLIATGVGSGSSSGVVSSFDSTGTSWSAVAAAGFTDASGGGTSITFEPTFDGGTGRLVATGKSATNSITVSSDNGSTWNTSATSVATAVQFSSRQQTAATTQTLFTTGGNSVAYVGNDTLFAVGGNDVHWTGKRWIATGKNTGTATATATTLGDLDITNNNTVPIAVSDDGITWQCVSSGQAPNLTEGTFISTNSRISSTPLIDSQITIMDGGDTEPMMVDGISGSGSGGIGTGIAQIDIIAELPVTSVSASNTTGVVTTIGVGSNNSVNGVGVTPTASFDNTAFTITTRPV